MTDESGARAANLVPGEDLDLRDRQIAVLGSWRQVGHVIYALAELSVADLLAAGPRAVEDLAAATQSNPAALRRVLRCAAAVGIFCEQEDGQFAMTALAEGLLSERAGSLRPMVLFGAADVMRLSYAGIMYSLRTGEPSFDQAFGVSFDEYVAANPEIHKFFIDFKAHWSLRLSDRFAGRLASGRFSRIADIRGGNGYLLSQVIKLNRRATGVLFDLPSVVADAGPVLKAHGVTDRVSVVGGDVLTDDLPADCDAYILNAVLHNLPERRCELLLRRVRQTMEHADS
jgi:multifunctional cyclase/dehydratase/O-methyltransferase